MSKKKVTMTLKDFHGGYIHSDLPLPSAPGQPSRPGDRGGIDRPNSFGNSVGITDNRLRPASAGLSRNLDDENPFFNYNLRIGRNFDEDERKPLHGASRPRRTSVEESISRVMEPTAENTNSFLGHNLHVGRNFDEEERNPLNGNYGPRRTISDESIHVQPPSKNYNMLAEDDDEIKPFYGVYGPHRTVGDETIRTRSIQLLEPMVDNTTGVRVGSKKPQLNVPQCSSSSTRTSYAGRVSGAGPNCQILGGAGPNGPHRNAWGLVMEIRSMQEPTSASWSTPDPAIKLAQASALEKVSTGRWTSKQHIPPSSKNLEVIGGVKIDVGPDFKAANNVGTEEVGHTIETDMNMAANVCSADELSHLPQTVSMDRFLPQVGGSYFGGPNSYWSKEPVSTAWSSQDINMSLSGSFQKVSYDPWNSERQNSEDFDCGTNKINMKNHDLSNMMYTKASLSAAEKMNDSEKDIQTYGRPQANVQALPSHLTVPKQGYVLGDVNCSLGHSNAIGTTGKAVIGPYSNPQDETKAANSMKKPLSAAWSSSPDVKGKFIDTGVFDKWNSKHPLTYDEVTGIIEPEGDFGYGEKREISSANCHSRLDPSEEFEFHNRNPLMNVERGLSVDHGADGGGEREMPTQERVSSLEKKNLLATEACLNLPSESLVRPKLKLLPRSKPLENSEPQVGNKQGFGINIDGQVADLAVQHPKQNLKPQLQQPLEQHKKSGNGDINSFLFPREAVFGGARPREMVLKERDAEGGYVGISKSQLPARANEIPRKDDTLSISQKATSSKYTTTDRQHDNKLGNSRTDLQRRNIRQNEPRKNHKEADQKHRQRRQERPSSPETWRKPIDHHTKPTEDHQAPLRVGKAASAVELAQTFFRSVCEPLLSGARSVSSGGGQVPFSRLVGPPQMLHTNGY